MAGISNKVSLHDGGQAAIHTHPSPQVSAAWRKFGGATRAVPPTEQIRGIQLEAHPSKEGPVPCKWLLNASISHQAQNTAPEERQQLSQRPEAQRLRAAES